MVRLREIAVVLILIHGNRGADLLHIVQAINGFGFFTRLIKGRQKHAGENRNDRDYNQKFDQRKKS